MHKIAPLAYATRLIFSFGTNLNIKINKSVIS